MNRWEELLQDSPVPGVTVTGGFHVAWSITQLYVKTQAVQGMLLTAGVCFIVLLLATWNFVVAAYAMFFVAAVLGSILTIINYFLEWEIGFTESLAIVVIIGFAGKLFFFLTPS